VVAKKETYKHINTVRDIPLLIATAILSRQWLCPWISRTTHSMTFEISVGISFFSLLLFPEHGHIKNVSYIAQRSPTI